MQTRASWGKLKRTGKMTVEYTPTTVYKNGNMISDSGKGIAISYNHLNLPKEITKGSEKVSYLYDATGAKLKRTGKMTVEYTAAAVYKDGNLEFIHTPEGYMEPTDDGFQYVYRITDHLGNVRVTFAKDTKTGSTTLIETNDFYPFGLQHERAGTSISSTNLGQNWKYQGQERTPEFGLNIDEWKYRISDPSIGRFWQVDPLAEDYVYNSTYAFQENKTGLGTELEGAELELLPWLAADATKNPNGVGAHTLGISQGAVNAVEGTINAIANPVQTLSAMGELLSPGLVPNQTQIGAVQSLVDGADKLVNGSGFERGAIIGEIATGIVGAKGLGATTKAIGTAIKANSSVKVFRVYGGDSGPGGKSYTTTNPKNVSNYRDAAGLPSGGEFGTNTSRFLIEGTTKNKNISLRRSAIELDGNKGGLPEVLVKDPNKVKIKRVSGINPEF